VDNWVGPPVFRRSGVGDLGRGSVNGRAVEAWHANQPLHNRGRGVPQHQTGVGDLDLSAGVHRQDGLERRHELRSELAQFRVAGPELCLERSPCDRLRLVGVDPTALL
jgi:hypothetical protein